MDIGLPETEREIEIAPLEEPLPGPRTDRGACRGTGTGVSQLSTEPIVGWRLWHVRLHVTSTGWSRSPGTT